MPPQKQKLSAISGNKFDYTAPQSQQHSQMHEPRRNPSLFSDANRSVQNINFYAESCSNQGENAQMNMSPRPASFAEVQMFQQPPQSERFYSDPSSSPVTQGFSSSAQSQTDDRESNCIPK